MEGSVHFMGMSLFMKTFLEIDIPMISEESDAFGKNSHDQARDHNTCLPFSYTSIEVSLPSQIEFGV